MQKRVDEKAYSDSSKLIKKKDQTKQPAPSCENTAAKISLPTSNLARQQLS